MSEEQTKIAIIASKGTLDMAYPPLILASAAAALDMEAQIFFTFYGLNIIHKQKMHNLKVFPHGNAGMPGPFQGFLGTLPGMPSMATMMMNGMMKKHNVLPIPKLVEICQMSDVKMIACQMTIDLFEQAAVKLVARGIGLGRLRQDAGHFPGSLTGIRVASGCRRRQDARSQGRSLRGRGAKDRLIGDIRKDLAPQIALRSAPDRDVAPHGLAQGFFYSTCFQPLFVGDAFQDRAVQVRQPVGPAPARDHSAGGRVPVRPEDAVPVRHRHQSLAARRHGACRFLVTRLELCRVVALAARHLLHEPGNGVGAAEQHGLQQVRPGDAA